MINYTLQGNCCGRVGSPEDLMTSLKGLDLGIIVEGHGEVEATPVLIRRIAHSLSFYIPIACHVRRINKSQLLQPGELEKAVEALTRQIGRNHPLLILLDADRDCPSDLASRLRVRCHTAHADVTISIVIAHKEYEAWFLAAAKSLAGQCGLTGQIECPADPESIRGAKEWLTARMPPGVSYSPARHQAVYSGLMDLSEARQARSFRKLEKELGCLLRVRISG